MDYAASARRAAELIKRQGAPAVVEREVDADYDASRSEVDSTKQTLNTHAVRIEYELRDIDGEHIRFGDAKLMVSPLTDDGAAVPELVSGNRVQFAGEWWSVESSLPIKPAATLVAQTVQVRK